MRFEVRLLEQGQLRRLRLEADSPAALDAALRAQGRLALSVRALGRERGAAGRFDSQLFLQELTGLLQAGVGLIEALQVELRKARAGATRAVLQRLCASLHSGEALSAALAAQPQHFDPLLLASVRASETSGTLLPALQRYLDYRAQLQRVQRTLVAALLYPCTLLGVGLLVLLFLLLYVLPRFAQIFSDLGRELPLFSRLLMQLGTAIDAHRIGLLALLALAGLALALSLGTPPGRQRWLQGLLQLPGLGGRLDQFARARLFRMLALLLDSGLPLLQACRLLQGLLSAALDRRLQQAARLLQAGHALSQALREQQLVCPVADSLLAAGERSGELAQALHRIADYYDADNGRWLERFMRLFEPLLMLVLGALIGGVVVMMYMPVFELAGALQ
ncbi:MAG: type II secretion system F family protein [Burkholderiaceae bacterium]|nr:type II secretion system F family protein [Burkholderiaceae bacterium]